MECPVVLPLVVGVGVDPPDDIPFGDGWSGIVDGDVLTELAGDRPGNGLGTGLNTPNEAGTFEAMLEIVDGERSVVAPLNNGDVVVGVAAADAAAVEDRVAIRFDVLN